MNNKQNDLVKCAMEKIRCDQKYKPNYWYGYCNNNVN